MSTFALSEDGKFTSGEGGEGIRWSDEKGGPETFPVAAGGEPFEGFQWRKDANLKLNCLCLLQYTPSAPEGHEGKVYFDDVVVATDYIGPRAPAAQEGPATQTR